jgi:NAD(P)-dependent dehydrogenase (short-subunit alcohol dehydrogenase family)
MCSVLSTVEAEEGVAIISASACNLRADNVSFYRLQYTTHRDHHPANLLWCTVIKAVSRKEADMGNKRKTVIVTGASQGIGAGVVQAFLDRGYNVVANSRNITKSAAFSESAQLVLVDGNIGDSALAAKLVETAISRFGSIDALVNNAGIFFTKAFTDYTAEDFKALSSTNLEGFLYVTQGAVKQMLAQKSDGSVVTITTSLVENPIAGVTASVPMITKGGLEAVTRNLASEYAKQHIRFNAVAPGQVDTPLHKNNPKDFLKTLSPMGTISDVSDIVDAVVYLTEARQVTGEVLHVDGGAHSGKW